MSKTNLSGHKRNILKCSEPLILRGGGLHIYICKIIENQNISINLQIKIIVLLVGKMKLGDLLNVNDKEWENNP